MSSLIIRKHSAKVWEHIPSDQPTPFYLSKFYISLDDNKIRIVEQGESKRNAYSVFNVSIEVVGGGTFSGFTSASALLEKLEELAYPAFYKDGELIPSQYDLSEFSNESSEPFIRKKSKIYKGLLNQTGTNKPEPIIFENDFSEVTFTYNYIESRVYSLVSSEPIFIENKTWAFAGSYTSNISAKVIFYRQDDFTFIIETDNNDTLINTPFLIEIYN